MRCSPSLVVLESSKGRRLRRVDLEITSSGSKPGEGFVDARAFEFEKLLKLGSQQL